MPHLHIDAFKRPVLPARSGKTYFDFIASNAEHNDEKLIAVDNGGGKFFLHLKSLPDKTLLKSDKLSRPSTVFDVKQALNDFADYAELNVLASNTAAVPNPHLQQAAALRTIRDFVDAFPTGREVRIEVGFGSGRHLLHQAAKHPDILFIGIEIHKPSIEQLLKQVVLQSLENLLVLDYDARLFMELVPSNIVGRIYVHFPVPWDKKPHRRVIGAAFVNESIRTLMPGGTLELRTDSDNYFTYSFETLMALNQNHVEIYKNRLLDVSSKYEDRWRRMEKNIYDVLLHNSETSPEVEPVTPLTFTVAPHQPDDDTLLSLNGRTLKFEEGFVHFERFYRIDDGRRMFRLSMGPFERPEHLYVVLGDENASYFPHPPVRSRINRQAHETLQEALYG